MKSLFLSLFLFGTLPILAQPFGQDEISRWKQQAQRITIIRDTWGVPHISGKTDADVVFGLLYTQCEDDFFRVEDNYLTAIGRMAEVEGEAALYQDLRARLFLDSLQAAEIYRQSPPWMKKLLDAFADGMNYFLYTHPEVKPRLLKRFQPWMPLMFSEGSIGGDITAVSLNQLKAFYTRDYSWSEEIPEPYETELTGSNGFAVAPSKSASGNALLLINPHTSFYFRSEVHMTSEEGLNAYGAVTWGQFFIYQGFNEYCGWMHTSSRADVIDEYLETVEKKEGKWSYRYGAEWRPVQAENVVLPYRTEKGIEQKEFTIYRTHHGPIIGELDGKWVSIRMMNRPLDALTQSYLRIKAKGYKPFKKVMKIRTNSSNNTVFADYKGNIAYWHGNFLPRRNPGFDWNSLVDGSDPLTDWKGLHKVNEIVSLHNPANGWLQNCNSTPFTAAGNSSPSPANYPPYMAPDSENYRGVNAVRVLSRESSFTLEKLIEAAFDPYLAGFEKPIPALIEAYDQVGKKTDPRLSEAIEIFRTWDKSCGTQSVATTLAIFWGEKMQRMARPRVPEGQGMGNLEFTDFMIQNTSAEEKLIVLNDVLDELSRDFGTWRMPWGEINRFQRLTGEIRETYDDNQLSIPVGFTSSAWGSLAAYNARVYPGTKKRYGNGGNSFVAVVEFGKRVKARSVVSGGQSSDPDSPHFTDQAQMFCEGKFKEVWFYPEEIREHAERTYRPGE